MCSKPYTDNNELMFMVLNNLNTNKKDISLNFNERLNRDGLYKRDYSLPTGILCLLKGIKNS